MLKYLKTIVGVAGIAGLAIILYYQIVIKSLDVAKLLSENPILVFGLILIIIVLTFWLSLILIKLHERQGISEKNIDVIKSEIYPFRNELSGMEIQMFKDGSFEILVEQVIHPLKQLGQVEERVNLSGGSTFNDEVIEVWGDGSGSEISHHLITDGVQLKLCGIVFSPSLKIGQKAHYFVRYKNNGGFLMTKREILDQVAINKWPFSQPIEYTSFRIRYETDRAYFRLKFPAEFKPTGERFYDVCLDHSYERFPLGHDNFERFGKFKKYLDEDNRVIFEIDDSKPTVGNNYVFTWIPPH